MAKLGRSASSELLKKGKKLKTRLDQLVLPERRNIQAVAVKYDTGKDKAPRIIAAGKGHVAERILQLAEEHKIPFFEDRTLTDLLAKLDVNTTIPPQLYTLVAEVLAFVYQLEKKAKRKRRR